MLARWLYSHRALRGEPATLAGVFRDQAPELMRRALALPEPAAADQPTAVEVLFAAGADSRRVRLELTLGRVRPHTGGPGLAVRWQAADEPNHFPTFDGVLGLNVTGLRTAELALWGQSAVPADVAHPTELLKAGEDLVRRVLRAMARELTRTAGLTEVTRPTVTDGRLHVRDVMTPGPLVIHEDVPLHTAGLLLLHHEIGGAPVVDAAGQLVGVLSESDLLAREAAPRTRRGPLAREEERRRMAATAGEACSRPAMTTSPDTTIREAARLLLDADIGRLVVVADGTPVGILSRRDVLRALTRSAAAIEEAVESALEAAGVTGVRAQVAAGGRVLLSGTATGRGVEELARLVSAVDGVTAVDNLVSEAPTAAARR